MKDTQLSTKPGLSPAEKAVCYILKRMTVDVNLRHYLIGTQAFANLVAAEAYRTGKPESAIETKFSEVADHCRGEAPDIVTARSRLKQLDGELDRVFPRSKETPLENQHAKLVAACRQMLDNRHALAINGPPSVQTDLLVDAIDTIQELT